jgi:hypothetical protein
MLHALHAAHDEVVQHTPSTQLPVRHWPPVVHDVPEFLRQWPAPSQVCVVTQVLGAVVSGPAGMAAQVPMVLMLQALHAVQDDVVQHVLSTQLPLRQSVLSVQPAPRFFRQWPRPSHAWVPVQVLGAVVSVPAAMAEHVPRPFRSHALHEGQDVVVQHTPSTQLPLAQSLPWLHVCPGFFFETQADIRQKLPLEQSLFDMHVVRQPPVALHV